MIDCLNDLLRHLLEAGISNTQVGFQPPDDDWRSYVSGLQMMALNVYLFDLRENRKLRSNARTRSYGNGMVHEQPAPARLDCHYLISAWSPATPSTQVEPTQDEHDLLYKVAAVLINSAPLNPSRIYPPGPNALDAVDEAIRYADLPTRVLPAEGFPKLAEFWGTMGANYPWKPAVYLIVTLPVILTTEIAGPMVTTRIMEIGQTGKLDTAETWIQIGGHVLDATVDPPVAISGAWVRLETINGDPLQTTTSDELGRFTFGALQPGLYQVSWRAVGYAVPAPHPIEVPSPTGEYDIEFA
jgi:hypothetical protein